MRILLVILLLCSSAFGQFQQKPLLGEQVNWAHPLSKGLVGLWLLNEGSGNRVFDLSGNGNTGTITGADWVPGKYGHSLRFDTSTNNLVIPDTDIFTFPGAFTCVAYVKAVQADRADSRIINQYDVITTDGWYLRQYDAGSGAWHFVVFVGGVAGSIIGDSPPTTDWQQLAVVREADGTMHLYVDSILQSATDSQAGTIASTGNLVIGQSWNETSSLAFLGYIRHILLYKNRALSPSEVAELYYNSFVMMQKDDIALMAAGVPAPTGGQVIMITSLPWILSIPLLLYGIVYLRARKQLKMAKKKDKNQINQEYIGKRGGGNGQ